MHFESFLLKAIALVALLAVCVAPAWGTTLHVKGGSGYGVLDTSSTGYSNCLASSTNCEAFQLAPFTLTAGGATYTVFQFASVGFDTVSGSTLSNNIDVFQISTTNTPSTFFLPLLNPSLDSGIFFCNNGTNNFAIDSVSSPLTGLPCTVGSGPGSFTETILSSGISFSFTGSFTNLTLYTQDGNLGSSGTVTAPEPSSILLLGTGIVAFAGTLRRRSERRRASPAFAS